MTIYENNKIKLLSLVIGFLISLPMIAHSSNTESPIIDKHKDSLQWSNAKDLPGAKVAVLSGSPDKNGPFVARVKLPANFQIPAHSHPINEYDTIISGALYLKVQNKKHQPQEIALNEGDFVLLPAGLAHSGYTKEGTIIQISGIGPWGVVYDHADNPKT